MTTDKERATTIAALNDRFRTTFAGGRVYLTDGVDALPPETKAAIIVKVKAFADFNADNDPYGEHDFGAIAHAGEKVFWKIDYYDAHDPDLGAEDPADAATTERALTIMLAEEY